MRQTRILRDRVRARSLKSRVDGISRSLTDNWHDTSNISFLMHGGFRDIHIILEKHTREIEVLWHKVVDAPMYEEATASDGNELEVDYETVKKYTEMGLRTEEAEQKFPYEAPRGWYPFGYHVDQPEVRLEFSMVTDDVGDPLWERPVKRDEDES